MDPELYSRKPAPKPVEELPLFAEPKPDHGVLPPWEHCPTPRDLETRRLVERAATVFRSFLYERGEEGGFLGECRERFKANGIITGEEKGRVLSWMAFVPPKAGAVSSGDLEWFHGNRVVRWRHPFFAVRRSA